MIIEIDQSGKVEQTSKPTILAGANGIKISLMIAAREKQKLQRFFRSVGKPQMYVYTVFAALVVILIRSHFHSLGRIVIDTEYLHQDTLLRNLITELLRKEEPDFDPSLIEFRQIGKGSPAHDLANRIYKRRQKPNLRITALDVWGILLP